MNRDLKNGLIRSIHMESTLLGGVLTGGWSTWFVTARDGG